MARAINASKAFVELQGCENGTYLMDKLKFWHFVIRSDSFRLENYSGGQCIEYFVLGSYSTLTMVLMGG